MLQIQSGTGLKELGESYILDYIKKGHVEVGKDLRDKKTYTLTKPLKDFYKGNPAEHPGRKSTRITLPEPNLSIQNELKIPEFLRKNYTPIPEIATAPLQDTFEQARQETKADIQALTKQPAHYRFAFTSDQTLIIFNNEIPMEIDKETTAKLVDFCDSIIRSAIL